MYKIWENNQQGSSFIRKSNVLILASRLSGYPWKVLGQSQFINQFINILIKIEASKEVIKPQKIQTSPKDSKVTCKKHMNFTQTKCHLDHCIYSILVQWLIVWAKKRQSMTFVGFLKFPGAVGNRVEVLKDDENKF